MPKIQIVTGQGTEQAGQALAQAIEQKTGAAVRVSPPVPTDNPAAAERLGQLLDTLAVLRETEATVRFQVLRLLNEHPELIRGSKTLTLDDRVANTLSNRQIIQERLGDSRSISQPEQWIIGGAAVASGADPWSVLAHIARNAMETTCATAGQYRDQLNTPLGAPQASRHLSQFFEAATDELDRD